MNDTPADSTNEVAGVESDRVGPVGVDLRWIPLGAGASGARAGGIVYEAIHARWQRRSRRDLYHSALQVRAAEGRYVIEQTPVPRGDPRSRGVVAGGAVGSRHLGRLRVFRYEIRCWLGGAIPDLEAAVGPPVGVTQDLATVLRVLDVVRSVPTPVWGRDESGAGEMWNSNSVVAWTLARAGVDLTEVRPPPGGRAPGWHAGLVVAGWPA